MTSCFSVMFKSYVRSLVMKENNNNECVSSKYEIDDSTFYVKSIFSSDKPKEVAEKIERLIKAEIDTIAIKI